MIKLFRTAFAMALIAGVSGVAVAGHTEAVGLLNDTGQATCYDPDMNQEPCDEESTGDDSPLPRQDGRYGRDAAAAMELLPDTRFIIHPYRKPRYLPMSAVS